MDLTDSRVLIADDNKTNQSIMQKMIELTGLEADCVSNGAEAVAAAHETAYALILMDIQMPVMDGEAAAKQILAEAQADKRPLIVAVTGNGATADKERYLHQGMFDVLIKPVRINHVKELVARCKEMWSAS